MKENCVCAFFPQQYEAVADLGLEERQNRRTTPLNLIVAQANYEIEHDQLR